MGGLRQNDRDMGETLSGAGGDRLAAFDAFAPTPTMAAW